MAYLKLDLGEYEMSRFDQNIHMNKIFWLLQEENKFFFENVKYYLE